MVIEVIMGLFIGLVVLAAVILIIKIVRQKPVVLVGKVVEKNFPNDPDLDSCVTIETSEGMKFLLKFETHEVSSYLVIGNDVFYGKAEELDKTIDVGNYIRVETWDTSGAARGVRRLLAVMSVK